MKTKVSKSLPVSKKYSQERINQERALKVMSILKEVAKTGGDIQGYHTPLQICEMILSKVNLTKAESILVLYNTEIVFALKKAKYEGKITFLTSSLKKVELVQKMNYNVEIEYINKDENPLYHLEMRFPEKFDIILSNPPYSKYLHLKFLERCYFLANDKVVFVHPSNSFINTKGGNSNYVNSNIFLEDKIESVVLFNGNKVFGIDLYAPCSITTLNPKGNSGKIHVDNLMTGDSYDTSSIEGITQFRNSKELWSLKSKIDSYVNQNGSLDSILKEKSEGNYIVEFTRIRGHADTKGDMSVQMPKEDFYTFMKKDTEVSQNQDPKYDLWFRFQTENEGKNFISFLKTDFARFSLAMYKFAQSLNNGELRFVPSLDFTQEWTDGRLNSLFSVSKEEQAFIKEIIPPYYD
jgi:hypothetical protein